MAKALVGIVAGSPSDLRVMREAERTLADLGVACELEVISAHRTPRRAAEYAESARERGLRVVIAGAGMAAHLAGAIAARTALPVIGVPIGSGELKGLDALLATAQMPNGVPVATVTINGAHNAALLAAQILALQDAKLAARLAAAKAAMARAPRSTPREGKVKKR